MADDPQMPEFLEAARRMLLENTEEIVRRYADALQVRVKDTLVAAVEETLRHQMEPFLERRREALLAVIEEITQKHSATLLARLKETILEVGQQLLQQQVLTLLERGGLSLQPLREDARKQFDAAVVRFKEEVGGPLAEILRVHVPDYTRRASGRVLDYTLAMTLFCLAAVFLLVGGIQALQEAGMAPYLTYILGGLAALTAGLVFLRIYKRAWTGLTGKKTRDDTSADTP